MLINKSELLVITKTKMLMLLTIFFVGVPADIFSMNEYKVSSPNETIVFNLLLNDEGGLSYLVNFNNDLMIAESKMGFILGDDVSLSNYFKVSKTSTDSFDETWKPYWGENKEILNKYNELVVDMVQAETGYELILYVRAFDEGVAFRYEFPEQKKTR